MTDDQNTQHPGLPVQGYKPQSQQLVDLVNENKVLEEQVLRQIDKLKAHALNIDLHWLSIGRMQLEQAFMAINRAVFRPGRAKLPGE